LAIARFFFSFFVIVVSQCLGSSAVGKSSFLRCLCKQPFRYDLDATIGADAAYSNHASLVIDGSRVPIKTQIIDTAGQEAFGKLGSMHMFIAKAHVIFFVYDVTNRESFDHLESRWVKGASLKERVAICCVILGTHIDKAGERKVSSKEGLALARKIGAVFCEISNRTGENMDELLSKIELRLSGRVHISKRNRYNQRDLNVLDAPTEEESKCCK
jgi:small GTP-binding protein